MPPLPLFDRVQRFLEHTAVIDPSGSSHTYRDLLHRSHVMARALLAGRRDLDQSRIAFLTDPGSDYAVTQWAIWQAGGIAVPLAIMHPEPELAFVIEDCDAEAVVADRTSAPKVERIAARLGRTFLLSEEAGANVGPSQVLPEVDHERAAMIVYTSGSTGRPKGVVTTHANIAAQIQSLVTAWEWSSVDRILLTLPLHHVHGIINVLGCAMWSGATCRILSRFDPVRVWQSFRDDQLTLFMAVPTIYRRLIEQWETLTDGERERIRHGLRSVRLMVSGSAALPVTTLERWQEITGHTLLERYGMTEIGMALSNPLRGERRPGHVGLPLPGVQIRLVDDTGALCPDGEPGEIHIKGPGVFREYWNRPADTRDAFDGEWFRTGDIAVSDASSYRILGRRSVDIIKTGGYKVSALEIEEVLRRHPAIEECAVVGVPDPEWGERVAVAVEGTSPTLESLREWALQQLAPYKVPSLLEVVPRLPRNALGKVVKPDVVGLFRSSSPL